MRTVTAALLAGLALCPINPSLAEPLPIDLFPLPEHSFDGAEKRVSDVAPILRQYGFDLPEGSEATFQAPRNLLYLKSSRKDINRLTRALEDTDAKPADDLVQVRITATCYAYLLAPDDFEALDRFRPTPEGLAALPKEKRRLLSRESVITRSGQRAKVESKRDHDFESKDEDDPLPAPAATFEVDPVIAYDRTLIELNMAYEITRPLAQKDRARHAKIYSAVTIANGGSAVFELGYLDAPEPQLLLLQVKTELLDTAELLGTERSKPTPKGVRIFPDDFFEKNK